MKNNGRHCVYILLIIAAIFSFTNIVSAAPLEVIARTGMPAVGVSGWEYSGLYANNVVTPLTSLPAPMFAGELVAFFSSLRQGAIAPATDNGIWLVNQNGTGRNIARHGQQVSGEAVGVLFNMDQYSYIETNPNVVYFRSGITGPGITPSINSVGIWETTPTSISSVLRQGDVAPGTDPTGYFTSLASVFGLDGTAGTDVAVDLTVSDLPGQPNTLPLTNGAWARTPQGLQMMYWSYGAVPGLSSTWIGEASNVMSSSGLGMSSVVIWGPGVDTVVVNGTSVLSDRTVWRSGPGIRQLIARTARQAPGTAEGVLFRSLPGSANLPAVNSQGTGVFPATLIGPGVITANSTGLWKSTAQGTTLLARGGDLAPAAGTGVLLDSLYANSSSGNLWVMDNNDTVFATYFSGVGVNLTNATGIYKIKADGTHQLIARAGTVYDALPVGTTLVRTTLPLSLRAIGNDYVMFVAQLTGTGVTTTNNDILVKHTESAGLSIVAREGQQIDNYIIKSFVGNGADLQLTESGYALVTATFSPVSNPNATAQNGLLGISSNGTPSVLAVNTYPLELSDGTTPTLNSFHLSTKKALNDSGQVVFSARLNPTSPRDEAVLVAQIVGGQQTELCHADFNDDDSVGVDDIFAFLSAWFGGSSNADTNGNGSLAVDDIFAFLSLWFAGC